MSDIARRQRFNAWRVIVIGTLVADAVVASCGSIAAALIATLFLGAMLALLATTPANAIVLARARSERILIGGAIALDAIAGFSASHLTLAFVAASLATLGTLSLRRLGISAWWAALIVWQPWILVAIRSVR